MATHGTPSASPSRSPTRVAPSHSTTSTHQLPATSSLLSQLSRPHSASTSQPVLVTLGPAPLLPSSSTATSSDAAGFIAASELLQSSTSGSVRSTDAPQHTDDDSEASHPSGDPLHSQHSSAADGGSAVSDSAAHSSTPSLSTLDSLRRLLDVETAADLAASNIIQPPPTSSAHPSPTLTPPSHPSPPHSQYRDVGAEAVWSVSSCKSGNGVAQLRDAQLDTFWQSDGHAPHTLSLVFARKVRVSAVCFYVDYKVDESYTPLRVSVRGGSSVHAMHDVAVLELEEPTGWVTVRTLVPHTRRHRAADDEADEADEQRKQKQKAASESSGLQPTSFFSASSPTGRLLSSAGAGAAKSSACGGLVYAPLRCHHLQLVVHSSHQQGKDTHVREVRVYGDGTAGGGGSGGGRGRVENKENRSAEQRSLGQKVALLRPVFTSIEFQSTACLR